jgi:tetratricopeptide (TPR) repeat protein
MSRRVKADDANESLRTKRGALLSAGAPALVVALILVLGLFAGVELPLTERYRLEASRRFQRGDFAGALVCYQRLVALEPALVDVRYALVPVLERLGRTAEATSLAQALAPPTQTGHAPAHLWLARRLMADRARLAVAEYAAVIERHLLRYLESVPEGLEGQALLGMLYRATGRPAMARPYLASAAGKNPERLLELARVQMELGDEAEAERHAHTVIELTERRAEAKPDDTAARLAWVGACVVLDDFEGALAILERGRSLTGDPGLIGTMADVCSAWADALARDEPASVADRLDVVERGLRYDGAHPALLRQAAGLMQGTSDAEAERARAALRSALARGTAPALAHLLLGNDAWTRYKPALARFHWEQANRLDPSLTLASANLARALAFAAPADPARALDLLDGALAGAPGDARLLAVRGLVLVKLERWKPALVDLERALRGGEASPELHTALAGVYEHLGIPEIAAEHRLLRDP